MRTLVLLALTATAALPLSAHDHWHDRRPVIVIEESCRPAHRWENRRWENRWERHAYNHHRDWDDDRVAVWAHPLALPFQGRIDVRLR